MTPRLRLAVDEALQSARHYNQAGDLDAAFAALERAHVLGQRSTRAHLLAHAGMLRVGWRRRDGREVAGQLLRLLAALLFTWLWVPRGNTGGANVSAFRPLPVPADLARLLEEKQA